MKDFATEEEIAAFKKEAKDHAALAYHVRIRGNTRHLKIHPKEM